MTREGSTRVGFEPIASWPALTEPENTFADAEFARGPELPFAVVGDRCDAAGFTAVRPGRSNGTTAKLANHGPRSRSRRSPDTPVLRIPAIPFWARQLAIAAFTWTSRPALSVPSSTLRSAAVPKELQPFAPRAAKTADQSPERGRSCRSNRAPNGGFARAPLLVSTANVSCDPGPSGHGKH